MKIQISEMDNNMWAINKYLNTKKNLFELLKIIITAWVARKCALVIASVCKFSISWTGVEDWHGMAHKLRSLKKCVTVNRHLTNTQLQNIQKTFENRCEINKRRFFAKQFAWFAIKTAVNYRAIPLFESHLYSVSK